MKTINIPLEDKEYKALLKVKGNRTWHGFIEDLITNDKNEGGKENKNE